MVNKNQFERISQGACIESETQNHKFHTIINVDENGKVFELFVMLDDPDMFEMVQLVTRLSSTLLQTGYEPMKLAKELQDVYSPVTMHMIPGTSVMCPSISIIARIGIILEEFIKCKQLE